MRWSKTDNSHKTIGTVFYRVENVKEISLLKEAYNFLKEVDSIAL